MKMIVRYKYWRTLPGACQGGTATEFALVGFAAFLFMMAILNIGMLGFSIGALEHAVQATARKEAVAASLSNVNGNQFVCPAAATVQSDFNNYADPPLPASASTNAGNTGPLLDILWTDNNSSIPGIYVTLTATYNWTPIGFSALGNGLVMSVTAAAEVTGSAATNVSIQSSSCSGESDL
jgi:hypothetical protein